MKFGKNINNSGFKEAFKYRYLLILMGFFSLYAGFIYNDFASMPFRNYTSCYKIMVLL